MNRQTEPRHSSRTSRCLLLGLLLLAVCTSAHASPLTDVPRPVSDAVLQLVRHCVDSRTDLDERTVATVVDFVLSPKVGAEYSLPKHNECQGAYHEFDTNIAFPRFMEYSYSSLIPSIVARPSSLHSSVWTNPGRDMREMPARWSAITPDGAPVVIRGLQRDINTPDPTTGVYHEYDLKRTLISLNRKGRQVLVSVSKQIGQSSVGKKGVVLGGDTDWTYFYSNEPGTTKTGLGWAKSYVYDYFSVGVYAESEGSTALVKTGAFQWLRAGWAGINLVKPAHIVEGMKRYANGSRAVLESPLLPSPDRLSSVCQTLSAMPLPELTKRYAAVREALHSRAARTGKIGKSRTDENELPPDTSRERMVEELMLEYLKMTLGKPTALGKQSPQLFPAIPSS